MEDSIQGVICRVSMILKTRFQVYLQVKEWIQQCGDLSVYILMVYIA